MNWVYGVTTVPTRKNDLFPATLESLRAAGFDKPRLFVDGLDSPQEYNVRFGLEVSARYPAIRTAGNWILAMYELYYRTPAADRFAIFQDDMVTYRNLRAYLDKCEYPKKGYWNLYTFPSNQRLAPVGKNGWYESNGFGRGAVALVFSREAVMTLLAAPHLVDRVQDVHRGHKAIDGGVVTALAAAGYKEYVHNPSLVQHLGTHSSMGNMPHKQATSFLGDKFDAMRLLKEVVPCEAVNSET